MLQELLVLGARATACLPMVRALTTPGGRQPTGTGVGDGESALRDPGLLQGPGAHPAQPILALPAQTGPAPQ